MNYERFIVQTDYLIKAEEDSEGNKFLYLHASNELKDTQGETVLQKALEDSKDYFLSEGVISYDHLFKSINEQGRVEYNPSYVVGEPVEVKFLDNEKYDTFVKARIYYDDDPDKQDCLANQLFKLAKSKSTRLRASVGGKIIERDKSDKSIIKKVIWDDLAITLKPVNKSLNGVSAIPLEVFQKSFRPEQKTEILDNSDATPFPTVPKFSENEMKKAQEWGYDLSQTIDAYCWVELQKSLEATSQLTDTHYTGGRALQGGMTEKQAREKTQNVIKAVKNGEKDASKIIKMLEGFSDDAKALIYKKLLNFFKNARKN